MVLPATTWPTGAILDIFGSFPAATPTNSGFYRFESILPEIEISDGFLISVVLFGNPS